MFCNQCGVAIPTTAKFCQRCGAVVGESHPVSTAGEEPPSIAAPNQTPRAATWRCDACGRLNRPGTSKCLCANDSQRRVRQSAVPSLNTAHPSWSVTGVIGGIGGVALGSYVGVNMLIPFASAAFLWWLLNRSMQGPARAFVSASAIQGGHTIWMLLGVLSVGTGGYELFDVVLVAGGLAWLLVAPGPGPVFVLALYQAVALLINLNGLVGLQVGTFVHRAVVMHVALRVSALAYLFIGYRALNQPAPGTPVVAHSLAGTSPARQVT
jgi:hypothetical protein